MWMLLGWNHRCRQSMEQVLSGLEAIAQFTEELRGRIVVDGVVGLDGTLDVYRRLRTALDGIPGARIDEMQDRIAALEDCLRDVKRAVDELVRLRGLLGV
jgi:hypothetical protein